MSARWLFIVNPTAGNGAGEEAWANLEKSLRDTHIPYVADFPTGIEATMRVIRLRAVESLHGVVAVGGDGTVHGVVNGVMHITQSGGGQLPIGIIPIGHQNDFARNFSLPLQKPLAALRHLLQNARPRRVDVGVLTSHPTLSQPIYFANGVLIGLEPRFAELWGEKQRWRSMLDYWRHYAPPTLTVTYGDWSRTQPLTLLAYTNGVRHLGGLRFAPTANTEDGNMELTLIRAVSRFAAPDLLARAEQGKLIPHVAVTQEQTESVSIQSEQPIPLILDGESLNLPLHTLELESMAGGMTILV
jgi:diacylglycerol kinase (ATP)